METRAPKTSTLAYPKLNPPLALAAAAPTRAATSAVARPAASLSMCAASDITASEFARAPPANSAQTKTTQSTRAARRRRWVLVAAAAAAEPGDADAPAASLQRDSALQPLEQFSGLFAAVVVSGSAN